MTRKGFKLGAVALAATGAMCWAMPAHAFTGLTINGNVGNTIDPNLTVNNTVGQNGNRCYADIKSVALTQGPALSVSLPGIVPGPTAISQMQAAVTMSCPIPLSWPPANASGTAQLDTGLEVTVCFDVPSTEAVATTPQPAGKDITGETIYNGPFPSKFGWKVCSFAAVSGSGATAAQDSGVATFDAQGTYTFSDQAQLNNGATPTPVNTYTQAAFSGSTVTINFPYTWWTFDASTGKELGTQFLQGGLTPDVVSNLTVEAQDNEGVTLPTQACAPLFGCIQGVGGLLTTIDWAPGSEDCPATIGLCTQQNGVSSTGANLGNGLNLGLTGLGYPFGGEPFCTGVDGVNGAPAGSTGCVLVTNTGSVPPQATLIVYGRLIPPAGIVAAYQADLAGFTA